MTKIRTILDWLSYRVFRMRANALLKVGTNSGLYNTKLYNLQGKSNSIFVGNNTCLRNCKFVFWGGNNMVKIGNNVRLKEMTFWIEDTGNVIEIGDDTTSEKSVEIAACEGTKVRIGADCMLSHDIYMRTTDSHSILNSEGKRTNHAEDIVIGDHVWIGMQSLILKGVNIPDGCVVGARSLVSKSDYHPNSILVGHPTKELKRQIKWYRERK